MTYPNWFEQTAKENFEVFLSQFADKPNLKFLQIGAFTGDASLWMLKNILTDKSSVLVDVDTWEGSDEEVHDKMDFENVFHTYLEKTDFPNRFWFKCKSLDYLRTANEQQFDFIYIDGDHTASGVIDDAIMAWPTLKSGGIMGFDDYVWQHPDGILFAPNQSINFFLWVKQLELELLEVNGQVWVRKI